MTVDLNWDQGRTVDLHGREALRLARTYSLPINKSADPIEDEALDIGLDFADHIAKWDVSLLWCSVPGVRANSMTDVRRIIGERLNQHDAALVEAMVDVQMLEGFIIQESGHRYVIIDLSDYAWGWMLSNALSFVELVEDLR